MLTAGQRRRFATDGYVLVPGVVDEELLAAADAEIDALLDRDPVPEGTVGQHFRFLPPDELPAADRALRHSGALELADGLVAPDRLDHADRIQVALNLPPHLHRPGAPHIDGHRPDADISSFTMLAGVFLTDESGPERGNLWVWPGSHLGHERLFRERGVEVLREVSGHACLLDPPVLFGPGEPLLAQRGDLLLAHFLLGHNIGGNTSTATRRILYHRLVTDHHAGRWAETFVNAFAEYPSLRDLIRPGPLPTLPRWKHPGRSTNRNGFEPYGASTSSTPSSRRRSTGPPG